MVSVATAILIVMVALTGTMLLVKPAQLEEDGKIHGGGVVVLEPETWMGKRLPLLPYVKTDADLSKGTWVLVLIHPNCTKCQAVLPSYEEMARERAELGLPSHIAVIEVPTHGPSAQSKVFHSPQTACMQGRLMEEKEWFVETPIRIKIVEGMVVEAASL